MTVLAVIRVITNTCIENGKEKKMSVLHKVSCEEGQCAPHVLNKHCCRNTFFFATTKMTKKEKRRKRRLDEYM